MIKERDPIVVEMMAAYDNKPMPNLGLASHEVELLLAYIDKTSRQVSALAEASAHMEHVPAPKHDHSTHQHKHKHKH